MKSIVVGVVMLFAGFVFSEAVMAVLVEEGSNGKLRASTEVEIWKQTNTTIDAVVLGFGDVWKQAYAKSGTVIPVKAHESYARDGFLHMKKTSVADVGIIYDAKTQNIHLMRDIVAESRTGFNPFLIFWVLSMVAVTVTVWLYYRRRIENFIAAFAFAAAIATTFATFAFAFAAFAFAFAAFAFAATTFAAFAAFAEGNQKIFRFSCGVYYLCMVASLISFFLS